MENLTLINTLIALKVVASKEPFSQEQYQKLTGKLMWPSLGSRPDIAFTTGFLGRFNSNPTTLYYTT